MPDHTDPIIAEVRAIRQAYAARFNYDVDAMFKDLMARDADSFRDRKDGRTEGRNNLKEKHFLSNTEKKRDLTNLPMMYANCMEEIKKRVSVVDGFLKGEMTARYLQTTAECVALQLRKILELIALASMVANQAEYKKYRRNFRRDWNGKRILDILEKANPEFYPAPTKQILDPHTGKITETRKIDARFLTKKDYVELYDACGSMLHAQNPFSEGNSNAVTFLNDAPTWTDRIRALLNHHQIQPRNSNKQLWILMRAETEGGVHVYEFQRVPESRDGAR